MVDSILKTPKNKRDDVFWNYETHGCEHCPYNKITSEDSDMCIRPEGQECRR